MSKANGIVRVTNSEWDQMDAQFVCASIQILNVMMTIVHPPQQLNDQQQLNGPQQLRQRNHKAQQLHCL